jgi:hypothetical protein
MNIKQLALLITLTIIAPLLNLHSQKSTSASLDKHIEKAPDGWYVYLTALGEKNKEYYYVSNIIWIEGKEFSETYSNNLSRMKDKFRKMIVDLYRDDYITAPHDITHYKQSEFDSREEHEEKRLEKIIQ